MEPKIKEKLHAYIEHKGDQRYKLLLLMRWSTNAELTEQEVLSKIQEYIRKM